jgi:hypothetical protein
MFIAQRTRRISKLRRKAKTYTMNTKLAPIRNMRLCLRQQFVSDPPQNERRSEKNAEIWSNSVTFDSDRWVNQSGYFHSLTSSLKKMPDEGLQMSVIKAFLTRWETREVFITNWDFFLSD